MLTKLEAINILLRAVGESPVNSLASGLDDAEEAEAFLDLTTKEVLEVGWHFNTREDYGLALTAENFIELPSDTLSCDTMGDSAHLNVTVRKVGGKLRLFNLTDDTYTFTGTVYVKLVQSFDFESLPQALRQYIAWKAAGDYQQSDLGSVAIDKFIARRIEETKLRWLEADDEMSDANVLRDSESVRRTAARNNENSLR